MKSSALSNLSEFKKDIQKMIINIEHYSVYEKGDVLKLYPVMVNNDAEYGFMMIDEQNGCFPLFFDCRPHVTSKDRYTALLNTLKRMKKNSQLIYALLVKHRNLKDVRKQKC